MAIRLLHLADLHLGATGGLTGEHGETRRLDFQRAFDATIEFALAAETRVDAVLICGDLFDSHVPPPPLITHVQNQFSRLAEQAIPILLVPGLHDAWAYPDSVYRTHEFPGTHILVDPRKKQPVTATLKGTGVHFYGAAWRNNRGTVGEAFRRQDLPGLHVGLLHGDVIGEDADNGEPLPPLRFRAEELEATGFDYLALGYRHGQEVLRTSTPAIAYAGSLEATRIEETGPKALLVVSFQTNRAKPKTTLARVSYKARPMVNQTVDFTNLDIKGEHEGLAGYLMRYADAKAVARLELTGVLPFIVDANRLYGLLQNHFFHLDIEDHTNFSSSPVVQAIAAERTIRGLYTQEMLSLPHADPDGVEHAVKAVLKRVLQGELL